MFLYIFSWTSKDLTLLENEMFVYFGTGFFTQLLPDLISALVARRDVHLSQDLVESRENWSTEVIKSSIMRCFTKFIGLAS